MNRTPVAGIVVGHERKAPGASSVDGTTEYAYNCDLADLVQDLLRESREVIPALFYRADAGGYSRLPIYLNEQHDLDFVVELHFNAADGNGHGTEALHWHSSAKGKLLAGLLVAEICQALGTKSRGAKGLRGEERGAYLLRNTRMPAVIVEPFFGDNAGDWEKAKDSKEQLAEAIALAVRKFADFLQSQP